MKRFGVLFILMFFGFLTRAEAQPGMDFGIFGGLSTPNDEVNNVYNSDRLKGDENVGDLARESAELGYHIGAGIRMEMTRLISLTGGIGIHRFPESEIIVTDPTTDEELATLYSNTNIIPIRAGFNVHALKSFIGLYGIAQLTYNHISYTVDVEKEGIQIPINESENENNIGYQIGAGMEFDIELMSFLLEAKYNHTNLISSESNADNKSYVSLSLGIYL